MPNQKRLFMAKLFQRSLLLCVGKYSLYNSLLEILSEISYETKSLDVREKIKHFYLQVQIQMFRFPFKIRSVWEKKLLKKINTELLYNYQTYKPDLVFVYNSEFLLPETCARIKEKSKLIFFMGDSPLFTPTNHYYLTCLTYADLILSPDTFWIGQLNTLGIHQTSFFIPGVDVNSYHPVTDKENLQGIDNMDIFYAGASYFTSWGYKKALLMNQFVGFNFKLYGNSAWKRWFRFFPDLELHYKESDYIPTEQLNRMFNKTRLIPVDGNPAILNGFHLRLFEALGAGALPLVEYRKDVEERLFNNSGLMVPLIKDYKKAGELARYYLQNENERSELAKVLREYILSHYSAALNSQRIIELLKKYSGS